jgi:hypothetical protein
MKTFCEPRVGWASGVSLGLSSISHSPSRFRSVSLVSSHTYHCSFISREGPLISCTVRARDGDPTSVFFRVACDIRM